MSDNSYPNREAIATLALISGVDDYNSNIVKEYYNGFIGKLITKMLAVVAQLPKKVINCRIISLSVDENINTVGNFSSNEYRQVGKINISKYIENSNSLFTERSHFLSSLSDTIKTSISTCFRSENANKIKITLNATYLLQRYIERKIIQYFKEYDLIKESTELKVKPLFGSKVNIIMVNFCNTIVSHLKDKISIIGIQDLIELNYIINLALAHIFNTVNNIDKSKKINRHEIFYAAMKMISNGFEFRSYKQLDNTDKLIDLYKYHRNGAEPTPDILKLFNCFISRIIIILLENIDGISVLFLNSTERNSGSVYQKKMVFLESLGYFDVKYKLDIHEGTKVPDRYIGFVSANTQQNNIVDNDVDFYDIESTLYNDNDVVDPNFSEIILENDSDWNFYKGNLYFTNYSNVEIIVDNYTKKLQQGVVPRDHPIVSDVNPELVSILNSLTIL